MTPVKTSGKEGLRRGEEEDTVGVLEERLIVTLRYEGPDQKGQKGNVGRFQACVWVWRISGYDIVRSNNDCCLFCLFCQRQEKEFEVTNEYIFALGSHVIYWSSKDVSLFIAQQVVADAIAAGGMEAAAAAPTAQEVNERRETNACTKPAAAVAPAADSDGGASSTPIGVSDGLDPNHDSR